MNTLKYLSALFLIIIFSNTTKAEQQKNITYKVNIPEVNQEPKLSAYLSAMENGNHQSLIGHKIDKLLTRSPINGAQSSQKTAVYLSYDKGHLYSIFMCFDDAPDLIRSTVSPRDEFSQDEDTVALHLIPFENSQQMYGFQANAVGSQIDGMFSEGVGWDLSFNPIWFTESLRTNNGYLVKIKIPLSSLRFPPGDVQNWGFFVYRGIPRNNENAFFNFASLISCPLSSATIFGVQCSLNKSNLSFRLMISMLEFTFLFGLKKIARHFWLRDSSENPFYLKDCNV